MTDNSLSIEELALAQYAVYWENRGPDALSDRWRELQQAIYGIDTLQVNNMLREACVEMFKAGFMLRLTGE